MRRRGTEAERRCRHARSARTHAFDMFETRARDVNPIDVPDLDNGIAALIAAGHPAPRHLPCIHILTRQS